MPSFIGPETAGAQSCRLADNQKDLTGSIYEDVDPLVQ